MPTATEPHFVSVKLSAECLAKGGLVLYYPPGDVVLESGELAQTQNLARDMLERISNGEAVLIPTVTDEHGTLLWYLDRGCKCEECNTHGRFAQEENHGPL